MDPVLLTSVCVLVAMGVGILYVMAIKPETVEAIVAVLVAMALAAAGARLGDMRAKRRVPQQVSARTPVDVEL
jgi:hypothetical protein